MKGQGPLLLCGTMHVKHLPAVHERTIPPAFMLGGLHVLLFGTASIRIAWSADPKVTWSGEFDAIYVVWKRRLQWLYSSHCQTPRRSSSAHSSQQISLVHGRCHHSKDGCKPEPPMPLMLFCCQPKHKLECYHFCPKHPWENIFKRCNLFSKPRFLKAPLLLCCFLLWTIKGSPDEPPFWRRPFCCIVLTLKEKERLMKSWFTIARRPPKKYLQKM